MIICLYGVKEFPLWHDEVLGSTRRYKESKIGATGGETVLKGVAWRFEKSAV